MMTKIKNVYLVGKLRGYEDDSIPYDSTKIDYISSHIIIAHNAIEARNKFCDTYTTGLPPYHDRISILASYDGETLDINNSHITPKDTKKLKELWVGNNVYQDLSELSKICKELSKKYNVTITVERNL